MMTTSPEASRWIRRVLAAQAAGFLLLVAAADLGWARAVFEIVDRVPAGDKLLHFLIVGSLAFSAQLALQGVSWASPWVRRHGAAVLVGVPVLLEEASQYLLTTRDCDPLDLACDALGILVFSAAARRASGPGGILSRCLAVPPLTPLLLENAALSARQAGSPPSWSAPLDCPPAGQPGRRSSSTSTTGPRRTAPSARPSASPTNGSPKG